MDTCDISCDAQYCDTCKAQDLSYQELAQIKLIVARAKLDYAKGTCLDIEKLLETARSNLCYCLGEYERAVWVARESFI